MTNREAKLGFVLTMLFVFAVLGIIFIIWGAGGLLADAITWYNAEETISIDERMDNLEERVKKLEDSK